MPDAANSFSPPALFLWAATLRLRMFPTELYTAAVGIDLEQSAAIGDMLRAAPSLSPDECACALIGGGETIAKISSLLLDKTTKLDPSEAPLMPSVAANLPESLRLAWSRARPFNSCLGPEKDSALNAAFVACAEPQELHRYMGGLLSPNPKAQKMAAELAREMRWIAESLFGAPAVIFAQEAGSAPDCASLLKAGAERNALAKTAREAARGVAQSPAEAVDEEKEGAGPAALGQTLARNARKPKAL